jgi:predicted DsbA family dithiol-disulfide isomerase
VVHAPYQLSTTLPATGVDKYSLLRDIVGSAETLDAIFDAFVKDYKTAGGQGVPKNGGLLGNTMDAHRLMILAQEQGLGKDEDCLVCNELHKKSQSGRRGVATSRGY